jgi:hypothetical protein
MAALTAELARSADAAVSKRRSSFLAPVASEARLGVRAAVAMLRRNRLRR